MDTSTVGRFGTLRLMKRGHDVPTAAFPIDDDQVSLGSHPSCSVRLYYSTVSPVHCKIVFCERKAFLLVLGEHGLLVDGCPVFPSTSSSSPTTIPLSNNSEIEIHKKRFVFAYPPKAMRAALLVTPTKDGDKARRALRLSMIRSAHVFSPAPSADPSVNLRLLQSPVCPPRFSESRAGTSVAEKDEENEEEIVLVHGDHPHVVEEDNDLVILEDVALLDTQDSQSVQTPVNQRTPTQVQQRAQQYEQRLASAQTPRGQASLHRAVLIRSAQRAVLRAEMEREEEEEEMEVMEAVVEDDAGLCDDVTDDDEEETESATKVSGWRKSLEAVGGLIGLRLGSAAPAEGEDEFENTSGGEYEGDQADPQNDRQEDTVNSEDDERYYDAQYEQLYNTAPQPPPHPSPAPKEEESDIPASLSTFPHTPAPARRALGSFMTPQAPPPAGAAVRLSLGGGGARRVRVEATWRVRDIVLPPSGHEERRPVKEEIPVAVASPGSWSRPKLSEEERKAIQERRRSALSAPDPLFAELPPGARRTPAKVLVKSNELDGEEEEKADTRTLLERMRAAVEGMKRRRSMSPRKGAHLAEVREDDVADDDSGGEVEKYAADVVTDARTAGVNSIPEVLQAAPYTSPATPSFVGVREMFLRERGGGSAEPSFEGVGEMMRTPAGYRRAEAEGKEDETNDSDGRSVEARPRVAAKKQASRLPAPTRRTLRARGTPAGANESGLADDEATPVEEARTRKGESSAVSESEGEEERTGAGRRGRLLRARKVALGGVKEEQGLDAETAEKPVKTLTKKARGEVDEKQTSDTQSAGLAPVRRGRKATSVASTTAPLEKEKDTEPASAPTRRTRKATRDTVIVDEAPAPAKSARKVQPRRGTRGKPIVVEEDEGDPLDSLGQSRDREEGGESAARTTRSRGAVVVKEEPAEEVGMSGGKKAAVAKKKRGGVPSGKTRARVAVGRRGVGEGLVEVDKENTPEVEGVIEEDSGEGSTRERVHGKTTGARGNLDSTEGSSTERKLPVRATRARK